MSKVLKRFVAILEDLVPVKTEPDFGHNGRWQHLRVVTLMKASFPQSSSHRSGCFGENPRFGSPRLDDGDAWHRSPCYGHGFWSRR
jgi:hypothetical protein